MNIKNKTLVQLGVFVVFVFLATNVYAWGGQRKEGEGKKNREEWKAKIEALHKELGVTPEQEQQLKAQKEGNRQELNALRKQIEAKRDELRQALQEPGVNNQKAVDIHNQLKVLLIQKEDMRFEGIQKVKEILTHEQFIQFQEKMKQHRGKGKERSGEKHQKRWMQ